MFPILWRPFSVTLDRELVNHHLIFWQQQHPEASLEVQQPEQELGVNRGQLEEEERRRLQWRLQLVRLRLPMSVMQ